jgi:type IV pilus assembly protein PilB
VGLTRQRLEGNTIYQPVGCSACNQKGYKGRKGAYELMEMTPDLREMSFQRKPTMELRAKARSEGMTALKEDGVRKILAGITTIQEILRITHRDG